MRQFLKYLFLLLSSSAVAQDECPFYLKYIDRGNASLADKQFRNAINSYSIALVHCPQKTNETWALITIAFQKIESLKDTAVANEKRAIESEKEAQNAKLISDAYKYIFFAQDATLNDPSVALHLSKLSISLLDSTKKSGDFDSLIYEKAQRIYYQDNFGETLITNPPFNSPMGKNIAAVYASDGKAIWTITGSAYAVKWNLNGKIVDSFRLDSSLNQYSFKILGNGSAVIHGYDIWDKESSGKIWNFETNKKPFSIADTVFDIPYRRDDSITFFPDIDTTKGWTEDVFVTGYRAFHFNQNGDIVPLVKGVSKSINQIGISPNGKMIAVNNNQTVKVINTLNKVQFKISNTGGKPVSLGFSPDSKILVVRQNLSLSLFDLTGHPDRENVEISRELTLRKPGFSLQSYTFSANGEMLLLSFTNLNNQVTQLYKKARNNYTYALYSELKCPGSSKTSAYFSENEKEILTSSDKVRRWKIPLKITKPKLLSIQNSVDPSTQEVFYSIEFDSSTQLINAYTLTEKKYKFDMEGNPLIRNYADSTYKPDSLFKDRLTAFLPNNKVAVISENGVLQLFNKKEDMEVFLQTFRFEPFTEAQKRKYGIK